MVEHLAKNDPLPTTDDRCAALPPSRHPCPNLRLLDVPQDIGAGEVTEALNKYPGKAPAERSRGCSDHSWT